MATTEMNCLASGGGGLDFDEIAYVGTHNGYTGETGFLNISPNYLSSHRALQSYNEEQYINVTGECASYVCNTRYGGYIDVTASKNIKVTVQETVNSNISYSTVNISNGQTQRFSMPSSSSGDYAYSVLYVKGV